MDSSTVTSSEVYLLPLKDNGAPDVNGEYIYLAPTSDDPITIRFVIDGTSSICRNGSLWVNIPAKGSEFRRDRFTEYKLVAGFNRNTEVSIPIYEAGAFAFYTSYAELPELSSTLDSTLSSQPTKQTPLYYIDVAPRLSLNGRPLPLPALSIFSIISKLMGKYPTGWEKHLQGISARGYNMLHFTPLQIRGASNSPYSLYDQLGWDPECFPRGEEDVQTMVDSLERNHSLLSLTDIVLNHTAHNSKWLLEHPEAGYNLTTAPWLESAYLLDTQLLKFGSQLVEKGYPNELKSVDDLLKIMDGIKEHVFAEIRLWEFYALDVNRDADAAIESWTGGKFGVSDTSSEDITHLKDASLKDQAKYIRENGLLGDDRLGERFRRRIDPKILVSVITAIFGNYRDGADTLAIRTKIVEILDIANVPFYDEYDREVAVILQQLSDRIKYVRLDDHGPKLGIINDENPLIESYFTRLDKSKASAKLQIEDLVLVNNGWVWSGNALVDNAGPQSRAYLRREVVVWGDCVKLRYGKGPEDSPWLWDHMTRYARMLAKYFAGFRIDNCHSTPLHVAEHILDEARRVRPNLYVVAELFTGSEEMDYVFVKRLGLSSLIREAMQAWSTAEMSRLVHRHGGRPIGSFEIDKSPKEMAIRSSDKSSATSNGIIRREKVRNIQPMPAQALFMDCTHDNELPAQKRDARDTLPNAALVCMCSSATGSVMGYDEIYPKLVDLVHETRLYTSESSSHKSIEIGAGKGGIGGVKKLLNQIHRLMGEDGYDETHIHHEDEYITVHRVHPKSRKGYFLIAHTAYPGYENGNGAFSSARLVGTKARHLGSWMLEVDVSDEARGAVEGDKEYLGGLPSRVIDVPGVRMEVEDDTTVITVHDKFPPGSIALFETWIPAAEHSAGLDNFVTSEAESAMSELDLVDLNYLMYQCEAEERDGSEGKDGAYDIPNYGKIVYAGLQGWWSVLKDIIKNNNLAHPLCQNLRDGQWAMDYTVQRLERLSQRPESARLAKPAEWLRTRFNAIRGIPSFLLPRYFALVIRTAYTAAWERGLELMSDHVRYGPWFLQSLAMVGVQQTGIVRSGSLWPNKLVPSLAAGLPHFAVEWARCWGRDVFISLRGLYIATGRFDEAVEHILAFASVLKHGMIPNLLSSGRLPRYNSRDSIWFFLQCIQDYTRYAPDGISLLTKKVKRRFLPYDDTWFEFSDSRAYSQESSIQDIIQEAMQRHAAGMKFREANAGPNIDSQMRDEGFNIEINVDWSNGLIFGGNQFNCGTWMDKMGESERAGSKGVPGTPRDGAAIEITGLLYSTLRWLAKLHSEGKYKYNGVTKSDGAEVTFTAWADLIKSKFEHSFYVPTSPSDDSKYSVNPAIVNRRGMYKDLFRSGKEYEDYQLRPNFTIAMTVAPDLFDSDHAMCALVLADQALRGPTGMATLDPIDMNYRPYYVNSEDSDDFATSKGRNYHQGPEWLWPTGFFLRALLKFDLARRTTEVGRMEAFQQITRRLGGCKEMINSSSWAGLTELTQKDGEHCGDSSPTQAWSAGCLIDLYMDAAEYDAA
ncbi:glucanotransferase domain of glycogen debranching enzyme-domain-containing protein [Xylaria nigripes]|nr:glucanotransferase domain of glycogen debranching enzyme-domain-containing protein [Xylaria nigripes]